MVASALRANNIDTSVVDTGEEAGRLDGRVTVILVREAVGV
jgi:hypothetical protein